MAVRSNCSCGGEVLGIEVIGLLEADEMIALMNECYAKFDFRHAAWNFRRSSLSGMSVASFRKIASAGAIFAEKRGPDAKTAMLVNTDAEVALFRAFAHSVADISQTKFAAFRSEQEMEDWLAG
ncbi:MAG: hypothetical protein RIM33_17470 [Alphaproteobacteria bacterium]